MTPLGPLPPPMSGAASSAGSFATGSAERAAKLDAAGHSLAAGQHELSLPPLDADANTSADRDADGWTGGTGGGSRDGRQETDGGGPASVTRPRLPDDPSGERLDVTV